MTSFFETIFAATDPIQDTVYGETFLIEPLTANGDVNARRTADASRPSQTITGIWSDPHVRIFARSRAGHRDSESSQIGDDKPAVDFVTTALPYRLVLKDRITRIKDGTRYEIADPGDGEFSRTMVALTAARGP